MGYKKSKKTDKTRFLMENFVVHKGRPIFGLDGWSGKKGQNGTRQVGWLVKKDVRFFSQ